MSASPLRVVCLLKRFGDVNHVAGEVDLCSHTRKDSQFVVPVE